MEVQSVAQPVSLCLAPGEELLRVGEEAVVPCVSRPSHRLRCVTNKKQRERERMNKVCRAMSGVV
jgi:hypothetical protein